MTMIIESPQPSIAKAPFDDVAADTILRTSDQVDFHVYKIVLMLASPFFKQMFTVPQPETMTTASSSSPITVNAETPPIIPIAEDSETIDHLLRLCYPVIDPEPGTLPRVSQVLEAAIKYEFEEAMILMDIAFRSFISSEPLRVFAIACRLRLESVATVAANAWKVRYEVDHRLQAVGTTEYDAAPPTEDVETTWSTGWSTGWNNEAECAKPELQSGSRIRDFSSTLAGASYMEEMTQVSAGAYFRLLQFVRTGAVSRFCDPPINTVKDSTLTNDGDGEGRSLDITINQRLLDKYPTDIILQSSDGYRIRTHSLVLSAASADAILDRNIAGLDSHTSYDSLPVIQLEEDSSTLANIVRLCHPLGSVQSKHISIEQALKLSIAARKYNIPAVMSKARAQVLRHQVDSPLRVFFIAVHNHSVTEAQEAARALTRLSIKDLYVDEMESTFAPLYRHLLEYHFNCQCRRPIYDILSRYGCSEEPSINSTDFLRGSYSPVKIAASLVRRELGRDTRSGNRNNGRRGTGYGKYEKPSVVELIKESHQFERDLQQLECIPNISLQDFIRLEVPESPTTSP